MLQLMEEWLIMPVHQCIRLNTGLKLQTKKDDCGLQNVTIAGRFCESGDILIKDIELPQLAEGDILAVYNTGAYNYSMASNYNRVPKSEMVLVNNSKSDIIINRETLEDLISHDIVPDRFKNV